MFYKNVLSYFSLYVRKQENLMSQIQEVGQADVSLGIAFEI